MKLGTSILVVGGTLLFACTANTVINADLAGRGNVPANETEVSACKSACTSRAKCEGAQPSCEALCEALSSDDAVAFKKCVDKSACDPSCDGPLTSPGPGKDPSAPDASAKDAASDAKSDGGGSSGDNLAACHAACEDWKVVECIDGTEAMCKSQCTNATAAERGAFASCATSSTTCPSFQTCWMALASP